MRNSTRIRAISAHAGQAGYLFLLFIIGSLVALYFGYEHYLEKYYIRFYDGSTVKFLEIPPFAERVSPAAHEFFGQCKVRINILPDQASMALEASCQKRGFFFKSGKEGLQIDLSPQYKIHGYFGDSTLTFVWAPNLSEGQKKAAAKLTAPPPVATASFSIKKK